MSFESYDQALERAAGLCGIDAQFWDIFGRQHVTSRATKQAILGALGVPCESVERIEQALEDRARAEWKRLLPPCIVASVNQQPVRIPLRMPADRAAIGTAIELVHESGESERLRVNLQELPETASFALGENRYVEKVFTLPSALPLGYYDVRGALPGSPTEEMRLIVTPERAYVPEFLANGKKGAGLAVSLYGLRSDRNWGCGDVRDLRAAVDWVAAEVGVSFIALNPLHAIHNRRPFNTSPYLPNSAFYRNPIYLDVEAIDGFAHSAEVRNMWAAPETQREVAELRAAEFVEYERVYALKLRFLRKLFFEFLPEMEEGTPRALRFQRYLDREGDLLNRFALYCALDEHIHAANPDIWIWTDWPIEYQDPESAEVRQFEWSNRRAILFHKYIQWELDTQLEQAQQYAREKGLQIGLYHDLALATDRFGSDLWAHRKFYVNGCKVGSPPDDFSPQGQDWAFPPPNSARHRDTGYRLFTESIRKACRHGGALRIDHVMRFFRLYWIPDSSDPTHGAYVRDRPDDLIRILALESVRNQVLIVGEDLGTVEPHVRETLERFGILSYRLFYFERNGHGGYKGCQEYPAQALVSSTTHDLPTLAGFWINADIEARRRAGVLDDAGYHSQLADRMREKQKMLDALHRAGLLPHGYGRVASHIPELTGELHNAAIGFLASTPSMLMAVNQEDLTKETLQQNLPGTTWQYPNWSRKMRFTLDDLRSAPMAQDLTRMFRNWLQRTGRV